MMPASRFFFSESVHVDLKNFKDHFHKLKAPLYFCFVGRTCTESRFLAEKHWHVLEQWQQSGQSCWLGRASSKARPEPLSLKKSFRNLEEPRTRGQHIWGEACGGLEAGVWGVNFGKKYFAFWQSWGLTPVSSSRQMRTLWLSSNSSPWVNATVKHQVLTGSLLGTVFPVCPGPGQSLWRQTAGHLGPEASICPTFSPTKNSQVRGL